MRTFTRPLLTGTLLLAGLGSFLLISGVPSAQAADPLTALQGVWTGARFDSGRGEDPAKGVKLALTIRGNHVSAQRLPSGVIGEGDFKLSGNGGMIDAVGTTGSYKGKNFHGVLRLQGNTLYWCTTSGGGTAQQRPKDFVAGGGNYLIVVKRQ